VPLSAIVSLLQREFFPKWFHVLKLWLAHDPDYDEITEWYLGWKAVFPAPVMADAYVKKAFAHALDLMNEAVDPHAFVQHVREEQEQQKSVRAVASMAAPVQLSFKDLVERTAEQNGILFFPQAGRAVNGFQVSDTESRECVDCRAHAFGGHKGVHVRQSSSVH
jgi:tuftelin-interacting protein 11